MSTYSLAPDPAPSGGRRSVVGLVGLFVLTTAAGWLFERMGAPLPWMIGPLLVSAAIFMGPAPNIKVPSRLRPVGQIVVATQVGLAFSPAALDLLMDLAPVIVGTALATGLCIFAVAHVTARISGQGLAQAFLSAAPTSPVEAASMAIAAGIPPMPVIFAQTFRLTAVVLILPFGLYAIDGWPDIQRTAVSLDVPDPVSVVVLAALGWLSARVFRMLRVPNPNFLGPIFIAAVLSVLGHAPAAYPPVILAIAQIVLGTWLGATFRREIVSSAIWVSLTSVFSGLLLLLLSTLSALGIAALSGVDWRTVVLGAAPGGAVEMALTAKFLEQNVILITTFHLARVFIFMPNIPWIVRRLARHDQTISAKETPK